MKFVFEINGIKSAWDAASINAALRAALDGQRSLPVVRVVSVVDEDGDSRPPYAFEVEVRRYMSRIWNPYTSG